MWSEKTPNGKVRFVERYEDPMTGKIKRVIVTMDKDTASTRKIAQASLNDKINAKLQQVPAFVKEDELTLHQLTEFYHDYQKATVSLVTCERNYCAAKSMLRILGRDTLVTRLTSGYVKERLALQNESPGTTNERITRFKAMIRWGYENDLISDIRWLDKVKKFKNPEKAQKLDEKFLESDQLQILLDNMVIDKWRLLTEFLALSGLRIGEAIALSRDNVDLDNSLIYVKNTYDPIHHILEDPKTASSDREVYLQKQLQTLCKEINLYMKKDALLKGYRSELFFSNPNGGYLDYYAYCKYLRENSERLLDKIITPHFLRHTHVALMAEHGIPLDIISRRLGHKDSKITRDIYFHVTKKLKEKDNAAIADIQII